MSGQDERLEGVEFRFAHLEHAHGALSDVLASQQKQLDELREGLRALAQRLANYEDPQGASAGGHEPPPHY